ncbi:helix-turn-helix transcriptional regulator [Candidatus Saccharibacteria bacterium]|nr:helix-turn-helix transcriptional regulator [Candidatus Saccharibacteria bacterium]
MIYLLNNYADFSNWCRELVPRAKADLTAFYAKELDIHEHRERYDDALRIKHQLYAIKAQLDEQHKAFLEDILLAGKTPGNTPVETELYREIYFTWSAVCFPGGKSMVRTLNPVVLGKELKHLRQEKELTADRVSSLAGIANKTLHAYEEGVALVKLDVLYKLSQIYNFTIEALISKASAEEQMR